MLQLEPLNPDQYPQVAKWEWGDDVDVDDYAAMLAAPHRHNFGVYQGSHFCASISIEYFGRVVRFHVASARHSIHPQEIADLLITMAHYLYQNGVDELEAAFPKANRAARRLAIRSWMRPKGEFEEFQVYSITKDDYYGRAKIQASSDAVSAAAAAAAAIH